MRMENKATQHIDIDRMINEGGFQHYFVGSDHHESDTSQQNDRIGAVDLPEAINDPPEQKKAG
ncbi:hypothetical protein GQ671_11530 [Salinicoccus hispanicus]|uniref:Uncharacterized protein n=2 Tax=Salinicoccus hispanicus TaxID=157225 RepID=A0A6N8U470_9STAP|nr:hypothetical protein [Salinicoccus hispanicus]MXQ51896.1 hypothetical protein [Salinicoccus hispanicus]